MSQDSDFEFNDIDNGWEVKTTLPEPIVLMRHLDRCLKLSSENLMKIDNRSQFKCSILGLEAALADYHDPTYLEDKSNIFDGKSKTSMEEIVKVMDLFSALKRLLRRSPLTENAIKRIEGVEE